ncbi:hypothetical protein Dimus_038848 [Dionaea muscipula]
MKTLFENRAALGVIVTDRDQTLINAVQKVFPDSSLSRMWRRHIVKDVEKRLVHLTKLKDYSKGFGHRWKKVIDWLIEEEFQVNLAQLECAWRNSPTLLVYLRMTWLEPQKERFVVAWIKHVFYFGAETTNKVKTAHS